MRRRRTIIGLSFALTMVCTGALADLADWRKSFPKTDFATRSISLAEVLDGGPGRDGIPAVDAPRFRDAKMETKLGGREPVLVLDIAGAPARAYPIRYLIWHEIVNDTVNGVPVAVTYCPLCNSGLVFDRRIEGTTLTFGVSGLLRKSDMIMYDRETESWWQQATGASIVGTMTRSELTVMPAWMDSWESFRNRYPEGRVLASPDASRPYGRNPYVGYDTAARPFLYDGAPPPHGIPPLERVVRVGDRAWPLSRFRGGKVVLNEDGVQLTWRSGKASALDAARIAQGRDVGAIRVRDSDTGQDLPHDVLFAFAFDAFWPNGQWMVD